MVIFPWFLPPYASRRYPLPRIFPRLLWSQRSSIVRTYIPDSIYRASIEYLNAERARVCMQLRTVAYLMCRTRSMIRIRLSLYPKYQQCFIDVIPLIGFTRTIVISCSLYRILFIARPYDHSIISFLNDYFQNNPCMHIFNILSLITHIYKLVKLSFDFK